jgi:LDH2 family malate/lactate/ureidoglycolate dehydrogenase
MRVDGFRPVDEFKSHLDNWIERFKSAKPIDSDQPVIIPGEPELEAEMERKVSGIPIIETVVKDLNELAERLGVGGLSPALSGGRKGKFV